MAYIDKELFKQDIKMRYCNNCARPNEIKCRACHVDDMLGEIEDAPTADVEEVVRCKDCTFRQPIYESQYTFKGKPAMVCIIHSRAVAEDGYCSYGKRRDT